MATRYWEDFLFDCVGSANHEIIGMPHAVGRSILLPLVSGCLPETCADEVRPAPPDAPSHFALGFERGQKVLVREVVEIAVWGLHATKIVAFEALVPQVIQLREKLHRVAAIVNLKLGRELHVNGIDAIRGNEVAGPVSTCVATGAEVDGLIKPPPAAGAGGLRPISGATTFFPVF